MRQIMVLSVSPSRIERLWGNWTEHGRVRIIPGIPGDLVGSHRNLAATAVAEGWGESVIVLQDDIQIVADLPEHEGWVTAYGTKKESHVCPHAFSADAEGWLKIQGWWSEAEGGICGYFWPDVIWHDLVVEVN